MTNLNAQPATTTGFPASSYYQPSAGVAILGTEPFRDTTATVQVGTTAAAPSAAGVVATCTPGTAGLWEVSGTVAVSGTTVAATDSNNMNLLQTAATVLAVIPYAVNGTTGGIGAATFGPMILNLTAADTLNVTAIGNATASSKYAASIVARRVG